jgi:DNA helicase II / ATP-dependent DNA helicase PcrA
LNFVGKRPRYVSSDKPGYFIDSHGDVYRDAVADLACRIDDASKGAVLRRLEKIYDRIFIDEVQDLVGYDLEILDRLFRSHIATTVVGDPRQHTFATSTVTKNKKYRGAGFIDWLNERSRVCVQEHRHESDRCQGDICEFASAIFPEFPPLTSGHSLVTGHDGVHFITRFDVLAYFEEHRPQVLRWDKRTHTQGLPAINIGVSKGSTYDRVLIFPTKPMLAYLDHRDPTKLTSREKLYVAVTRARHSVAFVV